MADPGAMRRAVESLMTRLLAGGETELAEQLVHPEFVNNEADPERRNGPSGAVATSEWLRSCFGNLKYDIHRVFVDGDMAAAYVTMHGTHEGGLPPGVARHAQAVRGGARASVPLRGRRSSRRALGGARRPRHGHAAWVAPSSRRRREQPAELATEVRSGSDRFRPRRFERMRCGRSCDIPEHWPSVPE